MALHHNYLDLLGIGYVIVNPAGYIQEKNQTFTEYFPLQDSFTHLEQLNLQTSTNETIWPLALNILKQKIKIYTNNHQIFECHIQPLLDENNAIHNLLLAFTDITYTELLLTQLKTDSEIDHLTNIHNRRKFDKEFTQVLEYCKRTKESGALLIFDIDAFKEINDELGHAIGDKVLQDIGRVASSMIRQYELLARIGGDEFAILIGHSGQQAIERIQNQLLAALRKTEIQGSTPKRYIEISMGYALFEDHHWNRETLYMQADKNLYLQKKNKKQSHLQE